MSLFGFLRSSIKTVVSPATDLLDGDLSFEETRENFEDVVDELEDTFFG